MKSIVRLFLILYLCAFSYPHKSRKDKTMMQAFNDLSVNSNTKAENNEVNKLKTKFRKNKKTHSRSNHKSRISTENSALANLASKEAENLQNFITKQAQANQTFLYTGWQQISSRLFKNENLFPTLKVPNQFGKIVDERIKIDNEDYRINSKKNPAPQGIKDLYFRMTKDMMGYASDATDVNYLQIFHFEDYDKVEELSIKFLKDRTSISCFDMIEKTTKFRYKICSADRKENLKFMCIVATRLLLSLDSCWKDDKESGNAENTFVKQTVLDATIIIPLSSKDCNDKWNYDNRGDDWECLCKTGTAQSPIDLPSISDVIYSPITPLFQFDEVPAKIPLTTVEGEYLQDGNIKIKYLNGAIRVLHPNLGKVVTLNGSVYIAEEISVHTPSEHTKDGKRMDMELQITFYGVSKGDIASQVVLSFLFEKKPGYYNKFVDDLDFYTLPNKNEPEKFILNDLFIPKIFYSVNGESDPDQFVTMKPFSFYTYDGSLTMPPCSEDTIHYVAYETIPIGSVVLDLANEALKMPDMKRDDSTGQSTVIRDDSNVENYRSIQERNHRQVFFFDHTKYTTPDLDVPQQYARGNAHYERIKRGVFTHIFVPGTAPSGIPGSFVESKNDAYGIVIPENRK